MAAEYPPLTYFRQGVLVGAEVDMALQLGQALGRRVEFIHESMPALIENLHAGKIDVLMSGISITPARQARMIFAEPYMVTGQMAMMRRPEKAQFTRADDVFSFGGAIGVKAGTTGDQLLQDRCANARRITLSTPSDAPFELRRRRIDLFIHDAPAVLWMLSSAEADVAVLPEPLSREELGWAFSPAREDLRDQVNVVLAGWKNDGTLDTILQRWMPYLKKDL